MATCALAVLWGRLLRRKAVGRLARQCCGAGCCGGRLSAGWHGSAVGQAAAEEGCRQAGTAVLWGRLLRRKA
ncbi:hypothetical protein P7K49_005507, partial [Saguinus oedipus]